MNKKLLVLVILVNCLVGCFYFYPELTKQQTLALCFHRLEAQKPFKHSWSISRAHFSQLLDYLVAEGYKTLTCQQLVDFLQGKSELPTRSVVLTFDDAALSHAEVAVPELKKRNLHGVFFAHGTRSKEKEELVGDEAKKLLVGGEIQSHGFAHKSMAKAGNESSKAYEKRMSEQLEKSREEVKRLTGKESIALAYPGGEWSSSDLSVLKLKGFKIAFTVEFGYITRESQPYGLPRLVVTDDNDLDQLSLFLDGGRSTTQMGAVLSLLLTLLCLVALLIGKSNGRQTEN